MRSAICSVGWDELLTPFEWARFDGSFYNELVEVGVWRTDGGPPSAVRAPRSTPTANAEAT